MLNGKAMRPCMSKPYNTAPTNHYLRENARKLALVSLAVALISTATSCRKAAIATADHAAARPASEAILEADKLYSGRTDLVKVRQGIDTEKARQISKLIRDSKLKVQAQIQGDQLRVSSKVKDQLQAVMQLLKAEDLGLDLQFVNYR